MQYIEKIIYNNNAATISNTTRVKVKYPHNSSQAAGHQPIYDISKY